MPGSKTRRRRRGRICPSSGRRKSPWTPKPRRRVAKRRRRRNRFGSISTQAPPVAWDPPHCEASTERAPLPLPNDYDSYEAFWCQYINHPTPPPPEVVAAAPTPPPSPQRVAPFAGTEASFTLEYVLGLLGTTGSASASSSSSSSSAPLRSAGGRRRIIYRGRTSARRQRCKYDPRHFMANFLLMAHSKSTALFSFFAAATADAMMPLQQGERERIREHLQQRHGSAFNLKKISRAYYRSRGRKLVKIISIANLFSLLHVPPFLTQTKMNR